MTNRQRDLVLLGTAVAAIVTMRAMRRAAIAAETAAQLVAQDPLTYEAMKKRVIDHALDRLIPF